MIHENKVAIARATDLVSSAFLPECANKLFMSLLDELVVNYVQAALTHLMSLFPASRRNSVRPNGVIFHSAREANAVVYLVQRHFADMVKPTVQPSIGAYQACMTRKNEVLRSLEQSIEHGIDSGLDHIMTYCGSLLSKEQKKLDFKPGPDTELFASGTSTPACAMVMQLLTGQREYIEACLNGKNLSAVLYNFATRFYAVLLKHITSMSVNELGVMVLSRDISEYTKCIEKFKHPQATKLFESLREGSATLTVAAENLEQLFEDERLAEVPVDVCHAFAKMRPDYRSADLASLFKKK